MVKIEPAVTQLMYDLPNGTSYIDLAKDLSRVNRRLYRQGYTYVVQDIQMHSLIGAKPSDITLVEFSTSGNSWIVHNAWTKGYNTWRDMQNEYMDGMGSRLKGKWADFKIYLDDAHAGATQLEPIAGDGAAYDAGDWAYSNFVYDDAGTSRSPSVHMIGTSTDDSAIGLIEAYGDARNYVRATPSNPSEIATGFYAQFHGIGDIDDELGTDLRDDNDLPPYDQDDYPGGLTNADAAVPVRILTCTGGQGSAAVSGFIAPCGLIKVENSELQIVDANEANNVYADASSLTCRVLLTVAAGPYRGVLASKMGQ